jgi:hypothetical protein
MANLRKHITKIRAYISDLLVALFRPLDDFYTKHYCLHLDTAFQTMYRQEFVPTFEQRQSLLRQTVTTEAQFQGNTAVFLVAGSGGATAQTRGVNGLITPRSNDLTQNSCALSEWNDLVRMTNFNIFASQGNQRQIMQQGTVAVINRKIDDQILTELNTGTITVGAASATPTVSLFQNGRVKLTNAAIPWGDGKITFLAGASYMAFLEEAPEFSNANYVNVRPYSGSDENPSWQDKVMAYRWRNTLLIEHPAIPGKATTSEKGFLYHRDAIGQAANIAGMDMAVGYNDEQAYSYARASMFMGAKLLQNTGVIVFTYDGTIYG